MPKRRYVLIEGLMLVLIERNVLSVEELTAVVEGAVETKESFIAERRHPGVARVAAGILRVSATASAGRPLAETD